MAKRNGTEQDTSSEQRQLSPEQELVLLGLLEGLGDAEAGERAGVSRSTVQRWKSSDALFVARLGAERKERWDASIDRMRNMLTEALTVIGDALHSESERVRVNAAFRIVAMSGLSGLEPVDSTDARDVEAKWRNNDFVRSLGF